MKQIIITGGCGFIGSHISILLLEKGYTVHIIDNLYNSHKSIIDKIKEIIPEKSNHLFFHYIDLCHYHDLLKTMKEIGEITAVIHCAGLKSVKESVSLPLLYYHTNLLSTLNLLNVMKEINCKTLLFSSSATVYGKAKPPLSETTNTGVGLTNPYGKTKFMIEEILKDEYHASNGWKMVLLRYFNPVGAHPSGMIGENPNGIPNNLMPYVMKVAGKELEKITVYGKDYETTDGTGVRDYIHIMDLAKGHSSALEYIINKTEKLEIFNLGSGIGTSVMEMIDTMKEVSDQDIPFEYGSRRPGDLPIVYCNPSKANRLLKWKTEKTIYDMCRDLWNYFTLSRKIE